MKVEEMTQDFRQLSEADKLDFFKAIMPSICEMFRRDPQKMMGEMMPLCREMMQSCGMDMDQIRRMMEMMQGCKG
jgi:hypothetical protein